MLKLLGFRENSSVPNRLLYLLDNTNTVSSLYCAVNIGNALQKPYFAERQAKKSGAKNIAPHKC